ncbi:MAG TPA: A24 family peptidase C-terminal domain-containing protein [Methanoregula sp.]|nr:A24 family peptidase C-terminal domain-containing protein [Methanoregula sp.]
MVISAVAVLVTLVYASWLDIRDRRVTFVTWLPMLCVGLVCVGVLIWQMTGNTGLFVGFLAVVAAFLYDDYLGNRGRTDSPCLAGYYSERMLVPYLAVVLILPAVSWFVLVKTFNVQLVPWFAMYAGVFLFITYLANRDFTASTGKKKKIQALSGREEMLLRWYFVLVIIIFAITSVILLFDGNWGSPALLLLLPVVFGGLFYTFATMNLFGGADAWALIFIAFCIPVFPIDPLLGTPPLGFLAFSVLINALVLNLAAPVVIFIINIARGNHAPLQYMFFGFPVKGDRIQESWGFVMEDFTESKGVVNRRFIGFFDSLRRMYNHSGRVYTKDLRDHPEKYTKELEMYKKAGTVWISYAVPFIVPITAGLITAVTCGDFLLAVMRILTGGM